MIWEIAFMAVWGIGALWFSQSLEHDDGKVAPIVLLAMIWPLFVLYVMVMGYDDEDDDFVP